MTKEEAIRLHNLIASRVPTDKLRQLEAKWRNGPTELSEAERKIYCDYRKGCAEELSALIKGDSNG